MIEDDLYGAARTTRAHPSRAEGGEKRTSRGLKSVGQASLLADSRAIVLVGATLLLRLSRRKRFARNAPLSASRDAWPTHKERLVPLRP
jgi:hypothetical protein